MKPQLSLVSNNHSVESGVVDNEKKQALIKSEIAFLDKKESYNNLSALRLPKQIEFGNLKLVSDSNYQNPLSHYDEDYLFRNSQNQSFYEMQLLISGVDKQIHCLKEFIEIRLKKKLSRRWLTVR